MQMNDFLPVHEELTGFLTRKNFEDFLVYQSQLNPDVMVSLVAVEISRFGVVNDSVGSGHTQ